MKHPRALTAGRRVRGPQSRRPRSRNAEECQLFLRVDLMSPNPRWVADALRDAEAHGVCLPGGEQAVDAGAIRGGE